MTPTRPVLTRPFRHLPLLALVPALLLAGPGHAQREVPFDNGVPVAPSGLADTPLGEGPFEYPTAEGVNIRVEVLARDIRYPTSMAFLPGDRVLVSTRTGELRLIDQETLLPEPVAGGPPAVFRGKSGELGAVHGYIDLALHPRFADNDWIYLSYTKPLDDGGETVALGRGRWSEGRLHDFHDIWVPDTPLHGPGRITFDHEGYLYMTTGGSDPQDVGTLGGKVLRLTDTGAIPPDNPFTGHADARGEVYSYGHRGALGLAVHPATGQVWQNENGPNGGDEINLIKPGVNYGWPIVSLGRTYPGPWHAERPTHEGYEPPLVYWMPAIAVSGMTFYTGDAFPEWRGDVFVGALRTGEIPGTGHIERILFNQDLEELRRESLLTDLRQRVRDIRQGPDGLLYVATDEQAGAILRIEPARR